MEGVSGAGLGFRAPFPQTSMSDPQCREFFVLGLGFRVYDLGFRIEGLGFRI